MILYIILVVVISILALSIKYFLYDNTNKYSSINEINNKPSINNIYVPDIKPNNEIINALNQITMFSSQSKTLLDSFIKSLNSSDINKLSLDSKNKLLLFLK